MSTGRRPAASPAEMERRVTCVVQAGYDYVRFSEHHYRFEGCVDFWPSTVRWRVHATDKTGQGVDTLIIYLKKRFPELAVAS